MPRFDGIPVDEPTKGPRFKGIPVDTDEQQAAPAPSSVDDYYSTGIYAGKYNPLGAVARSLDAATTAAGDTMTFGWGDEALGLASTDARDIARDRQKALRESNPIASVVGSI